MKYIIIPDPVTSLPSAVLFADNLSHAWIADKVAPGVKPLGAGFCDAFGNVWGKSDSLEIRAEPCDGAYVRLALQSQIHPRPAILERRKRLDAEYQKHSLWQLYTA